MAISIDIKTELIQLIERESDTSILQAIRTILTKTSLDGVLKEKLTKRALQSENDIVSTRLLSKEEMKKKTNDYLAK
jgi:hypothetical protein